MMNFTLVLVRYPNLQKEYYNQEKNQKRHIQYKIEQTKVLTQRTGNDLHFVTLRWKQKTKEGLVQSKHTPLRIIYCQKEEHKNKLQTIDAFLQLWTM